MAARVIGAIRIQECPGCHGLWAPEDRFDALVDRAARAARDRASAGEPIVPRVEGGNPASVQVEYRRCPTCDALMTRRNFEKRSGVIVDRCHEHGTWLDAHELERIAGYVLSGRADEAARIEAGMAARREREAARSAARRMQALPASGESEFTIFEGRRGRSAAETIFDLLSSLLT